MYKVTNMDKLCMFLGELTHRNNLRLSPCDLGLGVGLFGLSTIRDKFDFPVTYVMIREI